MPRTVTIAKRTDAASATGNTVNLAYSGGLLPRMVADSPAALFPMREYSGTSTLQAIPSTLNLTYNGPSGAQTLGPNVTQQRYADVIAADAPVSFWRFNEPAGSTVASDSRSSPGNPLTLTNVVCGANDGLAPVNGSGGAEFSKATSTALTSGYVPALNGAAFTLEAWCQIGSLEGLNRTILATSSLTSSRGAVMWVSPAGKLSGTVGTGAALSAITSANSLRPGVWYHVVFTSTSNAQALYLNGVQVASGSYAYLGGTTGPAGVGTQADGAFSGKILAEAAIYDYALTASQVLRHYQVGVGDRPASRFYMPLAPGGTEYAVGFDGTNSATCAFNVALNPATTCSAETWFWIPPNLPNATQTRHLVSSSGATTGYTIGIDTSNRLVGITGTGAAVTTLQGTTTLTAGVWHHAVLTVSNTTQAQTLYLDGMVEATATAAYANQGLYTFAIGAANNLTTVPVPFTGAISKTAVYSVVLTDAQVAERWAIGSTPITGNGFAAPTSAALNVTAASGTSPTLDLVVQERGFDNVWYTVGTFPQMTATGTKNITIGAVQGSGVFRVASTVGGTTPSFSYTVSLTA